jgi:hypothetical protein
MRRVWLFGVVLAGLLPAVSCILSKLDGSACTQDGDCAKAETCLFDLTRSSSYCVSRCAPGDTACEKRCEAVANEVNAITAYCTKLCTKDSDCPVQRFCDHGTDVATSSAVSTNLCVEKIRTCMRLNPMDPREPCNGLDDDCDGQVDGTSCREVPCLDDAACGAFVCQIPAGSERTICGTPNASASVADYDPCTDDGQCRNGLCETGDCVPTCSGNIGFCEGDFVCARAIGRVPRVPHNSCQGVCRTSGDCRVPGQRCVWRDVYQHAPTHLYVCSTVDPNRKPLGAACTNNEAPTDLDRSGRPQVGDDECQDGLCFGKVCTRPCEGPGSDCSDVGPGFLCNPMQRLIYGDQIFIAPVCVHP